MNESNRKKTRRGALLGAGEPIGGGDFLESGTDAVWSDVSDICVTGVIFSEFGL